MIAMTEMITMANELLTDDLAAVLMIHLMNLYCSTILFLDKTYKWPKIAVGIFYLSITALLNWYFINCLLNYTVEYLRITGFIGLCISLILLYLSQFKIVIEKVPVDEGEDIYEYYDE